MSDKLSITRRSLLKAGSLLSVSPFTRIINQQYTSDPLSAPSPDLDRLRILSTLALDAASTAGATYADIRITHDFERFFKGYVKDQEAITVGVRALVNGYWGFSSSPVLTKQEMTRIGSEAAAQAKLGALNKARPMEMSPRSAAIDLKWITPITIDPFELNPMQVLDHISGLIAYTVRKHRVVCSWSGVSAGFKKVYKTFADTDGALVHQHLYLADGTFGFYKRKKTNTGVMNVARSLDEITASSLGWELWLNPDIKDSIARKVEEINEDMKLPITPVDVGRKDVVMDSKCISHLLSETIGVATELDRALGFEANARGTSYITDPIAMLGSFRVGAPGLTVSSNRSEVGGAASVGYDDEGVSPIDFDVVDAGIVSGFHTTREHAGWLSVNSDYKNGHSSSTGSSASSSALDIPMTMPGNLIMKSEEGLGSYSDIRESAGEAILFEGGLKLNLDMMQLNGLAVPGRAYQLKDGKKKSLLTKSGILFRTPELWKSLSSIGGSKSVKRFGVKVRKGQPPQSAFHSVTAPPASFEEMSVIDILRKA